MKIEDTKEQETVKIIFNKCKDIALLHDCVLDEIKLIESTSEDKYKFAVLKIDSILRDIDIYLYSTYNLKNILKDIQSTIKKVLNDEN